MWLMLPMYILCLVIGLTTTTFGIWYVIDGVPLLKIICKDESTGMLYELSTGTTCELKYPIGAYVTLYELNGYVTLDKNSIKKTGGYTIG